MTKALNMLDRYHLLGSTVICSSSWLSARSELVEDDMFAAKEYERNNGIEEGEFPNLHLDTYAIWKFVGLHFVYENLQDYCCRVDCAILREGEVSTL
jgi:hypothetical protein